MRRTWFVIVACASLALSLAAPSAGAPAADPGGVLPPAAHADVDRDGLSDDLEHLLRGTADGDLVDVVVTLAHAGERGALERAVGPFTVIRQFGLIRGFAAEVTAGQARALAAQPGVLRVEPDFEVAAFNAAANADFGAVAARADYGVDGYDAEVCVVDTGVDIGHEQFDSKLDTSGNIPFYDAINGLSTAYDDHGHGTHVAGTAVGDGTDASGSAHPHGGVAPGAALSAAKVLDANGSGSASQVVAGVDWCADRAEVDVISMSLGSASSSDGNDSISLAVDAAVDKGKVVVVAAGNSGDAPYTVGSPAAARKAITVAAASEWSSGGSGAPNASRGIHLAPWSSRGPTADDRTKPDITAPGMTITSARYDTTSGYATYSGTSMATPFTSGAAALMLAAGATHAEVKSIIAATAQDRGPSGQDDDWGHGLLDVAAAVAQSTSSSAQTDFPTHMFISDSVANNGSWSYTFNVSDTTVPIAATVIIDGKFSCGARLWGACLLYEWDGPDLDVELRDPSGVVIDESLCPLNCHSNSIGRQETIDVMPTTAGDYTLVVYPYDGDPNNGKGGAFTVDLSFGPVATSDGGGGGGGTTNTAPVSSFTYSCSDLACDFDGTGSSDADGDALTYQWDFGDGNTATGATATRTFQSGGTYTVLLTVSDGVDSDTSSQDVTVTESSAGGIALDATGYKVRGRHTVDLTWDGATSTEVDVYRDGALIATPANSGAYTDSTDNRGGATYTYQVCEAGTETCSAVVTVEF